MFLIHQRHSRGGRDKAQPEDRSWLPSAFGAAMQQTDMRIDALDHFAVKLPPDATRRVRGAGMLQAGVDIEMADLSAQPCSSFLSLSSSLLSHHRAGRNPFLPRREKIREVATDSWRSCRNTWTTRFSSSFWRTSAKPVSGKSLRSGRPSKPLKASRDAAQVRMAENRDARTPCRRPRFIAIRAPKRDRNGRRHRRIFVRLDL